MTWLAQSQQCADTVEKLQIFQDGKFIYTVTIFKFPYSGREPKITISSDRAIGELTYWLLREVHDVLVICRKTDL